MNSVNMFRLLTQFFSLLILGNELRTPSRIRSGLKPTMNLTKKMILALGLLAGSTSFAQTENTSNGLLGQQFAEFNFTFIETDSISKLSYEPGVSFNLPLIANQVDVGGGYSYSRIRGPINGHANSLNTYAVGYFTAEGVKPFVAASLSHSWTSLSFGPSGNLSSWAVAAGVEIPFGVVTFTPSLAYSDDFKNGFGEGDAWTFRGEGNYWLNRRNAVFAAIAKTDLHRNPIDVWTYEVGVRVRF